MIDPNEPYQELTREDLGIINNPKHGTSRSFFAFCGLVQTALLLRAIAGVPCGLFRSRKKDTTTTTTMKLKNGSVLQVKKVGEEVATCGKGKKGYWFYKKGVDR